MSKLQVEILETPDGLHSVNVSDLANITVDSTVLTYNPNGSVATVAEDGLTKVLTYNLDGTLNTISWPTNGKTRTETYTYTSGVLTSITATEA